MTCEIKPAAPKDNALPDPQSIYIDGLEVGECTAERRGCYVMWHSVIRLKVAGTIGTYLVQGFGETPEQAIADGVVRSRREIKSTAELMGWLEGQLGTADKSDDEVKGGS